MSAHLLKLRNRHFLLVDMVILLLTPALAFLLWHDEFIVPGLMPGLLAYTFIALFVRLTIFLRLGLYSRYWAYASVDELLLIGMVVLASTIVVAFLVWIISALTPLTFAPSVVIIDALLVFVLIGATRFSVRIAYHHRFEPASKSRRILVYGAGDAGAMIVREMQRRPQLGHNPVAFLDDDPRKHNMRIHGVPVLGGRDSLVPVVKSQRINNVVIAMSKAPGEVVRDIVDTCNRIQVKTKVVPGISEILDGRVSVEQLRDVDIEDLLRREPVQTDIEAVRRTLAGRRVLVTGAGGSIGRELCRQILYCLPQELVILGHGENSIFETYGELKRLQVVGPKITPVIADIRFPERVRDAFEHVRPQIVFHAAAHKHVPLMESNPAEAITNNVQGTQNLLDISLESGVSRFVMISTDKAVNPTSIMGASKRVAEMLVHRAAVKSGRPYVAVRFGNVLGSRGSVVFTFKQQIVDGGPVTITDPEVERYFMIIPEAVQLVLQAAVLGEGGEVLVLDMGKPVRISDLARDMIRLSGLDPETDINIEYIGLRPGEKLSEELFAIGEEFDLSQHKKILIAKNGFPETSVFDKSVEALLNSAQHDDREAIVQQLQALVPEYRPPRMS